MERKKVDIQTLLRKKEKNEKITMLTAYDYPTARVLDEEGIDVLLVGDSVANVQLGYPNTLPVTMEEMLHHTRAVSRAVQYSMVIGDMPFMSYNTSLQDAVRNAGRFMKEAGADAIKLEGGGEMLETVRAVVRAGIPVCGHLGLTPQTAGLIGGYRVQGKTAESAVRILQDAVGIEQAGGFMLVLECVPDRVAELVTRKLTIPVIGIGAGADCDGQVLVINDLLGIQAGFKPKFVKQYGELEQAMREAVQCYRTEVVMSSFPTTEHSFHMEDAEFERLGSLLDRPDPDHGNEQT